LKEQRKTFTKQIIIDHPATQQLHFGSLNFDCLLPVLGDYDMTNEKSINHPRLLILQMSVIKCHELPQAATEDN